MVVDHRFAGREIFSHDGISKLPASVFGINLKKSVSYFNP